MNKQFQSMQDIGQSRTRWVNPCFRAIQRQHSEIAVAGNYDVPVIACSLPYLFVGGRLRSQQQLQIASGAAVQQKWRQAARQIPVWQQLYCTLYEQAWCSSAAASASAARMSSKVRIQNQNRSCLSLEQSGSTTKHGRQLVTQSPLAGKHGSEK